jgi:hypothetical protein
MTNVLSAPEDDRLHVVVCHAGGEVIADLGYRTFYRPVENEPIDWSFGHVVPQYVPHAGEDQPVGGCPETDSRRGWRS